MLSEGRKLLIKGQFRSYNSYENERNRLVLTVFAKEVKEVEIDEEDINTYENQFIIKVKDVVKALCQIAAYKRSLYNIPVIGITGSVGKTSTKDIIAGVMSTKYNVLKTENLSIRDIQGQGQQKIKWTYGKLCRTKNTRYVDDTISC